MKQDLDNLVYNDSKITVRDFHIVCNSKDETHVERKQQQRAITNNMILLALHYGNKSYSFQDISYVILDKNLVNTIYSKYISNLRGLTIIGNWINNEFYLITCYWNFDIKSKKRF